jgi:hypothetical protein
MPEHVYDYGTGDLIKEGKNFQALYEKVMNIPQAGRNLYGQWLAGRWKEAALNWAMGSNPDLNRRAIMDDATGKQKMTENEEGEMVPSWAFGENVGEEFEAYLKRLKDTNRLFGEGTVENEAGEMVPGVNRLNQLNQMGGLNQRAVLDDLSAITGFSGGDFSNEAFLNQAQTRFGRRGAQVQAQRIFSPEAARAFSISPTGQLDPSQNASFLNQRLAALRDRYGFSDGMSDRRNMDMR